MRIASRAWFSACALAWMCVAGAAPFVVQLGADKLVLDVPPGFSDAVGLGSPRLNELAESVAGPSNRLLVFAVTDGDLRRFQTGERPDLKRYGVAATPREFEFLRATPQDFASFVGDAMRGLGEPAAADSDVKKVIATAPADTPILLAVPRRDTALVSFVQGSRVGGTRWNEEQVFVLSATSLVLVRGRPLNLTIVTAFTSPADMEWLQFTSRRWLEQIQRLNP
jgi:hypothetical protein